MKTRKIIFILITILVLTSAPITHAKDNEKNNSGKAKIEIKVEKNDDDNDDDENKIKIETRSHENESSFEARGEITTVSGNSFTVLGESISIDPSVVGKFEQKGILQIGKNVKVEGIIINGIKYAKEIKVLGTGQGRFKLEIKNSEVSPIPSPSISPSITPTTTPSTTPSATVTPSITITPSSDLNVELKIKGQVNEITKFLEQILSFLRNII